MHRSGFYHLRIYIHAAAYHGTGADEFNESADTVSGCFAEIRVDALFISSGGFGSQLQPGGSGPDAGAQEVGGFHHDGLRIRFNFRIQAAHDACNCHGFFSVLDHQHVRGQGSLGSVQRGEYFAVFCRIHHDLVTCDAVDIEGVKRLAVFQHDEVGNIHDVIDRTHTCMDQPSLEPPRGIADFYILNDSGCIPLAERGFHLDADVVGSISLRMLAAGLRIAELGAEGGGGFSCHADHGQAVRTVRGDFEVDDRILQLQCLRKIRTHRVFSVQNPDAVSLIYRNHLVFKAQFAERAKHSVGNYTAELALGNLGAALLLRLSVERPRYSAAVESNRNISAFKYVRSTCYNLNSLISNIDLAYYQLISIRMLIN